jgi:hypothetical protein
VLLGLLGLSAFSRPLRTLVMQARRDRSVAEAAANLAVADVAEREAAKRARDEELAKLQAERQAARAAHAAASEWAERLEKEAALQREATRQMVKTPPTALICSGHRGARDGP